MFAEQGAAIYTLGVGDLFVENLARWLEPREVEYLIDLRSPPYRIDRPELEPEELSRYLKARGTKYLNLSKKLGDRPKDIALRSGGLIDYRKYRTRSYAREGLERIERAWELKSRVCILGREADPVLSHRARLIGQELHERGYTIRHLTHQGSRLMTHAELLRVLWLTRDSIHTTSQPGRKPRTP